MNIHEYQAKAVLREFGVPVPRGIPVFKVEEAEAAATELGGPVWVVKSQIHAGGRGKGTFKEADAGAKGGVRVVKSVADVKTNVGEMLGKTLVTIQTGDVGKQVNRLYIEDGSNIAKEFYISILVDRETSRVSFVVSTEGGMDIEEVAHSHPEKITTFSVDPATGVMPHHGRTVAEALGLEGDQAKQVAKIVGQLYAAFVAKDMAMLEINPLIRLRRRRDANVSMPRSRSIPTRSTVIPTLRRCVTRARRTPRRSRRRNTTSITSRSTARSAAWSTAPASRWRRWTSSSSTASEPANFLDVGGGATKEKVDGRLQDHYRRSQRERHPRQHLRRDHEMRRYCRGRDRRCEGSRPDRFRSSCASKAPTSISARTSSPNPGST